MTYDLFAFENSGSDLIVELLAHAGKSPLIENVFVNANTADQWQSSKNKKMVSVVGLETQVRISLKNKNWFFKHYNETVFFDNRLAHTLKSLSNNQRQILITSVEQLKNLNDRDLKRQILVEYSGVVKQIINKDFSFLYDVAVDKLSAVVNGRTLFKGYRNSVNLDEADMVIDLDELLSSNGKSLFDQLGIVCNKDYTYIVNTWKDKNLDC